MKQAGNQGDKNIPIKLSWKQIKLVCICSIAITLLSAWIISKKNYRVFETICELEIHYPVRKDSINADLLEKIPITSDEILSKIFRNDENQGKLISLAKFKDSFFIQKAESPDDQNENWMLTYKEERLSGDDTDPEEILSAIIDLWKKVCIENYREKYVPFYLQIPIEVINNKDLVYKTKLLENEISNLIDYISHEKKYAYSKGFPEVLRRLTKIDQEIKLSLSYDLDLFLKSLQKSGLVKDSRQIDYSYYREMINQHEIAILRNYKYIDQIEKLLVKTDIFPKVTGNYSEADAQKLLVEYIIDLKRQKLNSVKKITNFFEEIDQMKETINRWEKTPLLNRLEKQNDNMFKRFDIYISKVNFISKKLYDYDGGNFIKIISPLETISYKKINIKKISLMTFGFSLLIGLLIVIFVERLQC